MNVKPDNKMTLGAMWYPTGYHIAAWRHPEVPANAGFDIRHCIDFAKTVEAAKLDFIFLPDNVGVRGDNWNVMSRGAHRYVAQFEPLTLLSALSSVTRHIGLIASATTTYNEPFHIARKIASLDHLSSGRAGWNIVTSINEFEAFNFGYKKHPDHDVRYKRAQEFADVVKRLWNSWEDQAFVMDKTSGVFFDPDKVHTTNYQGAHFSVKGPLNIPRCPQGHPVIAQAGASKAGSELAAETAELVFTGQHDIDEGRKYYSEVKSLAESKGRCKSDLIIMPGVVPIIGKTEQQAQDKYDQLQKLIDKEVGLSLLGSQLGELDISQLNIDEPLPNIPETNSSKSRRNMLVELAQKENYTLRQLYMHVAGTKGHWQLIGTPEYVADQMELWLQAKAADGFIIIPPYLPEGMTDFIQYVLPELRKRGLLADHYRGCTLRENLGLRRPPWSPPY